MSKQLTQATRPIPGSLVFQILRHNHSLRDLQQFSTEFNECVDILEVLDRRNQNKLTQATRPIPGSLVFQILRHNHSLRDLRQFSTEFNECVDILEVLDRGNQNKEDEEPKANTASGLVAVVVKAPESPSEDKNTTDNNMMSSSSDNEDDDDSTYEEPEDDDDSTYEEPSARRIHIGGKERQNKKSVVPVKRRAKYMKKRGMQKSALNFEGHFRDLMSFKEKYGHCHVFSTLPTTSPDFNNLRTWCNAIKYGRRKLTNEKKQRLMESGLFSTEVKRRAMKVGVQSKRSAALFEGHFRDLMSFKEKYGHCHVFSTLPKTSPDFNNLRTWCNNVKCGNRKLTNEQKQRLVVSGLFSGEISSI